VTPSSEDLLRARLREVDDLQPPDDGFELGVLRAGRDRLRRRQSWRRGLVGAAAAVAVGALAVPTVARLGSSGGSATSASAGSGAVASKVVAPQGAEGAAGGAADASTAPSGYSPAECQATLARVTADRDMLTRQGYAVGSLSCAADGRVVLPVTNLVTAEQLQVLKVRYGDPVRVVQAVSSPATPSTP
jgi:hypothetical protein